tara:strand:- start:773 stop:919 length:147 start_codon:yes stop_codon:yes gene_type:complete
MNTHHYDFKRIAKRLQQLRDNRAAVEKRLQQMQQEFSIASLFTKNKGN